jgi:hypothetical protein
MLTQDFCDFLEYHLTKAFSHSTDTTVKGLWCDGILLPNNENDLSKKNVNDKREVELKAFIGKNGQDEYTLLMKFGNKSLSRYAKDLDIQECVPNFENNDWYMIDQGINKITIQLL